MSDETWLNAKKAVELGFADEILFEDKPKPDEEPEEKPDSDPDEPDKEEGGDEESEGGEEEKKKPFKLAEAVWQYSGRLMGETILNRLGITDEAPEPEADASAEEPPEAGVTDPPVEEEDKEPKPPVIGMDGKTEDGSMPYEILKDRLEWMK